MADVPSAPAPPPENVPLAPAAPPENMPVAPAPEADEKEKAKARLSFLQDQFTKLLASVDDEEDEGLSDEDDDALDPSPLQADRAAQLDNQKLEMLEREVNVLSQRFGGEGDVNPDEDPEDTSGSALSSAFSKLKAMTQGEVPTAPPLAADATAKERRRYERKFNKQNFILRQFMRIMVKLQTKEDEIIFKHQQKVQEALKKHDKSKMTKMDAKRTDFGEVARKTAYLAPKAIKGATSEEARAKLKATEIDESSTQSATNQAWLMEMSIKGATTMDRQNLREVKVEADMSSAALKAAYLGPKAAEGAANMDRSELKKVETKDTSVESAKEAYLAEQKAFMEAPKLIGDAITSEKVELAKVTTKDETTDMNKTLYAHEKTLAKIADGTQTQALTIVESKDSSEALAKLAYAQEKTQEALLNIDKTKLNKVETREQNTASLATAIVGPKAFAQAAEKAALGGKDLNRVRTDADMSAAALKAQYMAPKVIDEVGQADASTLKKTETKDGSVEAAKEAYLAEQKMFKEAPKTLALAAASLHLQVAIFKATHTRNNLSGLSEIGKGTQQAPEDGSLPKEWEEQKEQWLKKVEIEADMSKAALKAQYLGPKLAEQASKTSKEDLEKVETNDRSEEEAKANYLKEKTLASLAAPNAAAKLRRVSAPAPVSNASAVVAYLGPKVAEQAAAMSKDDLNSVARPDDNALIQAKAQYVQASAMKKIADPENKVELKKTETKDTSIDTAKQAYLDEQKKLKDAPKSLADALADVNNAPKLKKVEQNADMSTAALKAAVLQPKVVEAAAKAAKEGKALTKSEEGTKDDALAASKVAYVHEKNQAALENFEAESLNKVEYTLDTNAALTVAYAHEKTMATLAKGNVTEELEKTDHAKINAALEAASLKAAYATEKTMAELEKGEAGKELKKVETKDNSVDAAKQAYLDEQKRFMEGPQNIIAEVAKINAEGDNKILTKSDEGTKSNLEEATKIAYNQEKLQSQLNDEKNVTKLKKTEEEVKDTTLDSAKLAYVAEKMKDEVTKVDKEALFAKKKKKKKKKKSKKKGKKGKKEKQQNEVQITIDGTVFKEEPKEEPKEQQKEVEVTIDGTIFKEEEAPEEKEEEADDADTEEADLTKVKAPEIDRAAAQAKQEYMREKTLDVITSGAATEKKLKKVEKKADMSATTTKTAYLVPKLLDDVAKGDKKLKKAETKDMNLNAVKEGYAAEKKFLKDSATSVLGDIASGEKKTKLNKTKNSAETSRKAAETAARVGPAAAQLAADYSHKALNKTKTKDDTMSIAKDAFAREAALKNITSFNMDVLKSVDDQMPGKRKPGKAISKKEFQRRRAEEDRALQVASADFIAEKSKKEIAAYDRSKLRKIPTKFHRDSASFKALYLGPKAFAAAAEAGKEKKLKAKAEDAAKSEQTTLDAAKEAYLAEKKFYQEAPAQIFADIAKSGGVGEAKLKKVETKDSSSSLKEQYQRDQAIKMAASGKKKLKPAVTKEKDGLKGELEADAFVSSINLAAARGLTKTGMKETTTKDNSLESAKEAYLASKKDGAENETV